MPSTKSEDTSQYILSFSGYAKEPIVFGFESFSEDNCILPSVFSIAPTSLPSEEET